MLIDVFRKGLASANGMKRAVITVLRVKRADYIAGAGLRVVAISAALATGA
jgi:hypothetical protein